MEGAMFTPRILAAAAILLVVTPVVAQNQGGGPIGPGNDRGLQPSYGCYYPSYYDGGSYGYDDRYHPSYNFGYYPSYCDDGTTAKRYRSYDPASGTYVGHDGRRRLWR
jgi:uncharacterized membrane protein